MDPISHLSRPYIYVWIDGAYGTEEVEIAFTAPGVDPVDDDWYPAGWDAQSITTTGAEAMILVGPGGVVELAPGTYDAWARVTDPVQRPVLPSGQVPVT